MSQTPPPMPYYQVRSKESISEYLQVFNSVAILHLLEQHLVRYDPESRANITEHLLATWNNNIDARIKVELKSLEQRLDNEKGINKDIWGSDDQQEAVELMRKALENGKSSTFTIVDNTINNILTAIEKHQTGQDQTENKEQVNDGQSTKQD